MHDIKISDVQIVMQIQLLTLAHTLHLALFAHRIFLRKFNISETVHRAIAKQTRKVTFLFVVQNDRDIHCYSHS